MLRVQMCRGSNSQNRPKAAGASATFSWQQLSHHCYRSADNCCAYLLRRCLNLYVLLCMFCRFSAASPIPGPVSLSEHALVANQQEGLLLALGGCLTSGDRRHRHTRMFDQVRHV
jgi:hypothetical protein